LDKTPFSVLDLPPDADVEAARSRYRKLAREYHPDTASPANRQYATRLMAELNWAMEELERDPERWRAQIGSPIEVIYAPMSEKKPVTVAPALVLLNEENDFVAYVTAAAPDVEADALRLRYASEVIAVERLPSFGGVANFRVSLAEGVSELAAPVREWIEVQARGCKPVEVSVAVEAFTTVGGSEVSESSVSVGHPWAEFAGWGAAALGALGLLLYLA
jgi:hypothetical protein